MLSGVWVQCCGVGARIICFAPQGRRPTCWIASCSVTLHCLRSFVQPKDVQDSAAVPEEFSFHRFSCFVLVCGYIVCVCVCVCVFIGILQSRSATPNRRRKLPTAVGYPQPPHEAVWHPAALPTLCPCDTHTHTHTHTLRAGNQGPGRTTSEFGTAVLTHGRCVGSGRVGPEAVFRRGGRPWRPAVQRTAGPDATERQHAVLLQHRGDGCGRASSGAATVAGRRTQLYAMGSAATDAHGRAGPRRTAH